MIPQWFHWWGNLIFKVIIVLILMEVNGRLAIIVANQVVITQNQRRIAKGINEMQEATE